MGGVRARQRRRDIALSLSPTASLLRRSLVTATPPTTTTVFFVDLSPSRRRHYHHHSTAMASSADATRWIHLKLDAAGAHPLGQFYRDLAALYTEKYRPRRTAHRPAHRPPPRARAPR